MRSIPKTYLLPLLTALIVRAAMALTVDFGTNPVVAMMEYGDIGYNISQGNGYSMHPLMIKDAPPVVTAFMPPAQSFISAFLLSAFGNGALAAGFILNVFLSLVTVVVIAKTVGSIWRNERYVHIALWITALYPPFAAMNATFGIAVPVTMLTAVIFYYISRAFFTRTDKRSSRRYIISAGTAMGITWLFRAEMPLYIIFTAAMVLLYQKSSGWVNASVIIGIPLLVASPWIIRNYSVFERFIPMSSNGGLNFWRGNNEITFDNFRRSDDSPVWTIEPLWNEAARYIHDPKTFDKVQSDVHRNAAIEWIQNNPGKAAWNVTKKAVMFWTIDPFAKRLTSWGFSILHLMSVLTAVIGFRHIRKERSIDAVFGKQYLSMVIGWAACGTLIAAVIFPQPRLQIFTEAAYFPLTAAGIIISFDLLRKVFLSQNQSRSN